MNPMIIPGGPSFKSSGLAGIIAACLSVPSITLAVAISLFPTDDPISISPALIILLPIGLLWLLFQWGFYRLGKKYDSQALWIVSAISIALSVADPLIGQLKLPQLANTILSIGYYFLGGILGVFFSRALRALSPQLGKTADRLGTLALVASISALTVIGVIVTVVLGPPIVYYGIKLFLEEARREGQPVRKAATITAIVSAVLGLVMTAGIAVAVVPKVQQRISENTRITKLDKHLSSANIAWAEGNYAKVTQESTSALQLAKTDQERASSLFWQGIGLSGTGKTNEAETALNEAIKLDPKSAGPYVTLGSIRLKQNRLNDALDYANRAIKVDPKYDWAYNLRALVMADMGNRNGALADIDKAISLDPDSADFRANKDAIIRQFEN